MRGAAVYRRLARYRVKSVKTELLLGISSLFSIIHISNFNIPGPRIKYFQTYHEVAILLLLPVGNFARSVQLARTCCQEEITIRFYARDVER